MRTEKQIIRFRWFILASMLLFLSIIRVAYPQAMLALIGAGILYNLGLNVIPNEYFETEFIRNFSTLFDGVILFLAVVFSGGLLSLFFIFLVIYIIGVTIRYQIWGGLAAAFLLSIAYTFLYFNKPTPTAMNYLLTRSVIFFLAALGTGFLQIGEKTSREIKVKTTISVKKEEELTGRARESLRKKESERQAQQKPPSSKKPVEKKPPTILSEETAKTITAREVEETPARILKEMPKKEVAKARLEEWEASKLREKLTELAILHEASRILGASLVLEDVLGTTVDIAVKGLMGDVAGTFIYNEKTNLLTVGALRGFTGEEREMIENTTIAPGEGVLGEAFLQKTTLNIEDLTEETHLILPFNGRIKSFLVTPLATEGHQMGVLFIGKFVKEPFSKDSEEFIETIAGQAAVAIENAKLYQQAQDLAIHNGLTGIYNYRYFMRELAEEIKRAERYHRSVSLIMIDIDLFKRVNDTYGHQRGDEVLRGVAQTLLNNTRETDIVARYGGEEFVVILPETGLESAMEVASKLRIAVSESTYAGESGQPIKVTISLGVASYPATASNQEELLRQADDALYVAKNKRNTICSAKSTRPL